jgi:periplasmic copper chaperone A
MKSPTRRALLVAACALLPLCGACAYADANAGLQVRDAWARATPPGVGAAAIYLTIRGGKSDDHLTRVSTDRAAIAQVHTVTNDAGVTRMREAKAVVIPAGKIVTFAPQGGLHIMLMGLEPPLVTSERFSLTLEFAEAGRREIAVTVLPATATGPARP